MTVTISFYPMNKKDNNEAQNKHFTISIFVFSAFAYFSLLAYLDR